ncbi:ankyrin repeat-containing domain protein [Apiosordaria backusii]|uniref:Ankyrin repeat-containing domain protein n=1 Tax=Apiosordaria backusii TaxID=314023 RepID=A0AA40ESG3_9PEZI|nr:ankyrin repeat-containing domain protein [Apiosordaria backusii]
MFKDLNEAIESQAPPPWPLKIRSQDSGSEKWMRGNSDFQDWTRREGFGILHLHRSSGVSDDAEYACSKLSEIRYPGSIGREMTLYFKFDRHDCRRNNIRGMATAFLGQILGNRGTNPSTIHAPAFEPPLLGDSLTEADAFFLLNSVRLDCGPAAMMTWILDGLDECEPTSCEWFLSQLVSIAAQCEMYFKVLIATQNCTRIHKALKKGQKTYPWITLLTSKYVIGDMGDDPNSEQLVQDRPELETCLPDVRSLLMACWPDQELYHIVHDWLRVTKWDNKHSLVDEITMLHPPDSRFKLCGRILQRVPAFQHLGGRRMLLWIMRSMRALNPRELASALALGPSKVQYLDIKSVMTEIFGPLLDFRTGEVRFRQPWVRKYFSKTKTESDWYALSSPTNDHKEIARVCLQYLNLPEITERIVSHLAHYRLGYLNGGDSSPPPEELSLFFRNMKGLGAWFSANGILSPSHLRSNKSYLDALPVASYLGFNGLVGELLSGLPIAPGTNQMLDDALCEAARMGHSQVVTTLLTAPHTYSVDAIMNSMDAVACAAEFGVIETLLGYIKNQNRHETTTVQYPDSVICRVVWAGENSLLQRLLQGQSSVELKKTDQFPSPLFCAAAGGYANTIKILLDHGQDLHYRDTRHLLQTALYAAVRSGSAEAVKTLIRGGAGLEWKDGRKKNALQTAAVFGQYQVLKELLESGAEITGAEAPISLSGHYSALAWACCDSYNICALLLLDYGASIETHHEELLLNRGACVSGTDLVHPLCKAVTTKHKNSLEMVKLLLDRGADVNTLGGQNDTGSPFELAVEQGFFAAVELLIQRGADVKQTGKGRPALHRACWNGKINIVQLLLDAGADPDQVHLADSPWGPLHYANGHPDCIRALLDRGADMELACEVGTVLYIAAFNGLSLESVQLLTSRGANTEVTYEFPGAWDANFTLLLAAVCLERHEIARALLEAGASIKARTPAKRTVLHLAVDRVKSDQTLKVLLEYNPDMNAQCAKGNTALHELLENESPVLDLAKMLVKRGVDLEICEKDGYTALRYAIKEGKFEIAKYLVSAKAQINITGAKFGGPLHEACCRADIDKIRFLVLNGGNVVRYLIEEAGADVSKRGGIYFHTVLHAACLQGNPELLQFILDKAADDDVHTETLSGCRPIYFAAFHTTEHVYNLLARGADPYVRDKLRQTTLHTAVASSRVNVILSVLRQTNKQLVNEPDRDGWTPLMWALRSCDRWNDKTGDLENVVRLLLQEGADLWPTGKCHHRQDWSALRLAWYHGASPEVINLLTPKRNKTVQEDKEERGWDPEDHFSRKAKVHGEMCYLCLYTIVGLGYFSARLWLCTKCFSYRGEFFPAVNEWELMDSGVEFDLDSEETHEEDEGETESDISTPSSDQVIQVQTDEADYWSDSDSSESG